MIYVLRIEDPPDSNQDATEGGVARAPDDATTALIVRTLASDGRISFSELARRVHLSTPALIARVRKLEAARIIRGYAADIDPRTLGLPVSMYALLRCTRSGERRLREDLDRFPEVTTCDLVAGDITFVIRASLQSVDHAREFLDRLGAYGETSSFTVLDSLAIDGLPSRGD